MSMTRIHAIHPVSGEQMVELYSNCGQPSPNKVGLKHMDRGSVIAFGSGKEIDGKRRWTLDTVLGACAVEVLMPGVWCKCAGEVGSWPECGHLAGPTRGWKSHTGRPERKRFAFHTRSMGTARPGASALAGQHLPQHVARPSPSA